MNRKNFMTASLVLSLGFGLAGCSSSQQPTQQAQPAPNQTQKTTPDQSKAAPNNAQLQKAFQDELNGLTIIETDVKKGDMDTVGKIFDQIHDEFHAAVLPPIKAKNANLAKDMHSKFDELDDAIGNKDKNKILSLLKVNHDSLTQGAKELGISIK